MVELGVRVVIVLKPAAVYRHQFVAASQRFQSRFTQRLPFVGDDLFGEHHHALVRVGLLHPIGEVDELLPAFGGDKACGIGVGERFDGIVLAQEGVGGFRISADAHQIVTEELYGMVELVACGCSQLPFREQ